MDNGGEGKRGREDEGCLRDSKIEVGGGEKMKIWGGEDECWGGVMEKNIKTSKEGRKET